MSTADLYLPFSLLLSLSIGALSRYCCSFLPDYMGIPIGTATVNICGSFLLGFATSLFLISAYPTWLKTAYYRISGSIYDILDILSRQCKTHSGATYLTASVNILGHLYWVYSWHFWDCTWAHDAFKGKTLL